MKAVALPESQFNLSWEDIRTNGSINEADNGDLVITPRVLGSAYVVYRNGRLDISGRTVRDSEGTRRDYKYRLYKGSLTLRND